MAGSAGEPRAVKPASAAENRAALFVSRSMAFFIGAKLMYGGMVSAGGGSRGRRGSLVAANTPSCNSRLRSVNSSCLSSFSSSDSYRAIASACGA